ncbi:MAG: DUF1837 domain-containing protein [Clostridium sp.]|uniref:HamA C-terminal domain-containing protein n=1 Tax=Clostridium sp. TaxID=1506 RepID=UPI00290D3098|nr:DUF1837 domain-containing protein [Clostridium sp.]MDU7337819.1 DUF1837 domain-containing protein [Clostridium sp.]
MVKPRGLNITSKGAGFDSVFYEVHSEDLKLANPNCFRIFSLDVQNNAFSHIGLHQFLQKNIGRYVFSRAEIEKFKLNDEEEAIGLKAQELLRTAKNSKDSGAGGELGEILLYLFLEQKLNAPKLLSKIELKTSENQYVYGSDGIHLLNCNDEDGNPFCQLILGESKIIGSLKTAINDAFDSLEKANSSPDNELRLIETNIFKEAFDDATANYIKAQIVPSKRDLSYPIDKAFGVFLGYTLGLDANQFSNSKYRQAVQDQMKKDIQDNVAHIASKILGKALGAFSFYFYVLPFDDALTDRAAIIKKLKGE